MIGRWCRQQCLMAILIISISLMAGCTLWKQDPNVKPETVSPSPAVDGPFEYALSVYQRGDYAQAERLFNAISSAEPATDQCPRAQFGAICCRLMLAESPEDRSSAMVSWKALKDATPVNGWRVEQILFEPLILRLSVVKNQPTQPAPQASESALAQKKMEKELTALKKKAGQLPQLKRQLDEALTENNNLKQKIKALEAIDQSIQKKKTEISAPSD